MKNVTIDGIPYIGKLVINDDNTLTLAEAMHASVVNRDSLALYIKTKNLSELQSIEFGSRSTYTVAKFTEAQKLDLKVCKLNMKRAKATTAATSENSTLDSLLGKL